MELVFKIFQISKLKIKSEVKLSVMAPLDLANIIVCRFRVLEDSNLLYLIFSYLDPASVKEAVLVSRYVKPFQLKFST